METQQKPSYKITALQVDCPHYRCAAEPGTTCAVMRGRVFGGSHTARFGQVRTEKPDGPHAERIAAAEAVTRFLLRALNQKTPRSDFLS